MKLNLSYTLVDTRLGWIAIIGSAAGLIRITLPQTSPEKGLSLIRVNSNRAGADSSLFGDLPDRLKRYLNGERVFFPDELDLRDATPFQRAAWQVACSIPYGETRSYTWVAREIGNPKASRAVGQAMAANPFPLIVPCHRVVASDGSLGGFRGGLELKQRLLRLEAAV